MGIAAREGLYVWLSKSTYDIANAVNVNLTKLRYATLVHDKKQFLHIYADQLCKNVFVY